MCFYAENVCHSNIEIFMTNAATAYYGTLNQNRFIAFDFECFSHSQVEKLAGACVRCVALRMLCRTSNFPMPNNCQLPSVFISYLTVVVVATDTFCFVAQAL